MAPYSIGPKSWLSGLSARLLLLTIVFVMISEVLIFAPSIARFRQVYLEERIAEAYLAGLALEVPADNMVSAELARKLLDQAHSLGIVLHRQDRRSLILEDPMPPVIDVSVNLQHTSFALQVIDAFRVFATTGNRKMRIISGAPMRADISVETVIEEAPLRTAMWDFSQRILVLSVVISLMTASLVFIALQWLLVTPMRRLTESMTAFRKNPEDPSGTFLPGRRRDEIGIAERELANMQASLRDALNQKERLAALGTAITKINHDLRNILATARLVSDRLASSDDPNVRREVPRLLTAIDRAVLLCGQTLEFAAEKTPPPDRCEFELRPLIVEATRDALAELDHSGTTEPEIPPGFTVWADREQLFRVLLNLLRNAFEAGAIVVRVSGRVDGRWAEIEIADNGPGLSEQIRESLFLPFSRSGNSKGSGLGLAIARDLMRGHGGEIELTRTGPDGTSFCLRLPMAGTHSQTDNLNRGLG